MGGHPVQRKLTAILAVDVVGYSRLMGKNETAVLDAIKALHKDLFAPKVRKHNGRIVKLMGDGALVEFSSVVDAVSCAISVQQALLERNFLLPEAKRLELRIGIHIGDIIVEGRDIFGDGVNVAARLEKLSEPGGICLSEDAYRQVRNHLDLEVCDVGEKRLKNIANPMRVFLIRADNTRQISEDTSELTLPEKPSIAVLPFTNMSGDPEQEYFSDGITEDIITALSRLRWFFVIARNSTFIYKDQTIDLGRVSNDLGVRYVLEGSVRKAGDRVRITAQLVDAKTGNHIWAEKYDREIQDIFALQDEITQSVTAAMEPKLVDAEGLRSINRDPDDLDAWEMVARAMSQFWRATGPDVDAAISLLKETVNRFPLYAPAYSMLAFCLVLTGHFGWLPIFDVPKLAIESAQRAVELDDSDPWAYMALGYVAFVGRETQDATAHFSRAVELNPNFAAAHGYWGYALAFDGQSDEATERMSLAIRMSPLDRQNSIYMGGMAVAYYLESQYEEAISWARKGVQQGPNLPAPYRVLCASLAQAGRVPEAQLVLERIREMQPHISVEWVTRMVPYTRRQMPKFLEGLKAAGLT